jgi:type I restriction enzyme M protein
LLHGKYKQSEYGKVDLPLIVLRRFDIVLEPTKAKVLAAFVQHKVKEAGSVGAGIWQCG